MTRSTWTAFGRTIVTAIFITGFIAVGSASSQADDVPVYGLDHTAGLGAYPRSSPVYDARIGSALPEGTGIDAECFGLGDTITNYWGYSSNVWIRSAGY